MSNSMRDKRHIHNPRRQDEMPKLSYKFRETDWAMILYGIVMPAAVKACSTTRGMVLTAPNVRKLTLDFACTVARAHALWLKTISVSLDGEEFGRYAVDMIDWRAQTWPNARAMADAITMRAAMESRANVGRAT